MADGKESLHCACLPGILRLRVTSWRLYSYCRKHWLVSKQLLGNAWSSMVTMVIQIPYKSGFPAHPEPSHSIELLYLGLCSWALFSGIVRNHFFQKSMSLHSQASHAVIVSTGRHIQSPPWWTVKANPESSDSKLLPLRTTLHLMPDLLLMKYNIIRGKYSALVFPTIWSQHLNLNLWVGSRPFSKSHLERLFFLQIFSYIVLLMWLKPHRKCCVYCCKSKTMYLSGAGLASAHWYGIWEKDFYPLRFNVLIHGVGPVRVSMWSG